VIRYRLSQAFFVLALLTGATFALADWQQRPPLTFRPDDTVVGFGNTGALPDGALGWETAGAEDYFSAVIPSGAGLLVSSDANVDRSGSLAAGSTYLGVCSDDEASPTECLTARHDGTDGILASASGRLVLAPTGGLTSIRDANADYFMTFSGTDPLNTSFVHNANAQNGYITTVSQSYLQTLMAIRGGAGTAGGRQLVITDFDNRVIDHDHATPTDPTLFIHSAMSPDTDNTQWISLSHDQTNATISSGAGDLGLSPASGFLQHVRRWQTATVSFATAGGCATLATVQDGDAVTAILVQVNAAFDGGGTVDVGDGSNFDGFGATADIAPGSTGYKLRDHNTWGAYLYTATHQITHVYTGADTVDVCIGGSPTTGLVTVWLELSRFK